MISRGLLTFYVRSVRGLLAIARPYGPPYNSSSFVFLSAESLSCWMWAPLVSYMKLVIWAEVTVSLIL